ncbi:MAG: hypothetical protein LBV68_07945 [Spirochaetaceae bacterium]|jgi:hypothetical protein|nr:hypothetical protein [Spirochaetaceae bacterium]
MADQKTVGTVSVMVSSLILLLAASCLAGACRATEAGIAEYRKPPGNGTVKTGTALYPEQENFQDNSALFFIAETERSGAFKPGLGYKESVLRENLGDYAGAVFAAFKELLWAYACTDLPKKNDKPTISIKSIKEGLESTRAEYIKKDIPKEQKETVLAAIDSVLAFVNADYSRARNLLQRIFPNENELDSFPRWMELVCLLEEGSAGQADKSAYSAIRARYMLFPPYWYFGARHISDLVSSDYAEHCINIAPQGPYASQAKQMLAVRAGMDIKNSGDLLSKYEIDSLIKYALDENNPQTLSRIFPLLALNDNPYTLYATAALRSLTSDARFKTWFTEQEKTDRKGQGTQNRLQERLRYIARG